MPQEHMERLRRYLEEAASDGDDEARTLLAEIGDSKDEGLVDRLNEAALRWQASHPELSRLLGRVADLLSAEGI
jgi:hypothetical protein